MLINIFENCIKFMLFFVLLINFIEHLLSFFYFITLAFQVYLFKHIFVLLTSSIEIFVNFKDDNFKK